MKSFLKTSLLFAGALAIALPSIQAAEATATPAAPNATARPHRRVGPLGRMMIRHRVAQQLGLSADQITQLKANRTAAAASIKAVRADPSLTPEQKHARVHEIVANTRTQMKSVLTPEQQAKLQELRARHQKPSGA